LPPAGIWLAFWRDPTLEPAFTLTGSWKIVTPLGAGEWSVMELTLL
jgi:hypothetical protein